MRALHQCRLMAKTWLFCGLRGYYNLHYTCLRGYYNLDGILAVGIIIST